jgi:Protein of unknown function (DUF2442)
MRTSVADAPECARATGVRFTSDLMHVQLSNGRELGVPLAWFPRLLAATPEQLVAWELIGPGVGIHREALDEDISVAGLLSVPD